MSEHYDAEVIRELNQMAEKSTKYGASEKIALKAMLELVKFKSETFLLLGDDKVSNWWSKVNKDAKLAVHKRQEAIQVYLLKKAGWDKLSPADRKTLGLRTPIPPKGYVEPKE